VKTAAEELNKVAQTYGGLDVLGCNAGIMAKDDIRTADGYDVQMQANQLSHYLLTKLCMKSLEMAAESRGDARVVFHSSSARTGLTKSNLEPKYFQKCDPGTLGGDETMSPPWERYHQTKLANSAFAMALNDQLKEKGSKVKSLACDPGFATTDLVKNSDADESSWLLRCMTFLSSVLNASQSPANGSLSFVLCAFAPDSESGDFYMPSARGGMVGKPKKTISRGVPLKEGDEALTVSAENKTTVMEQCQKVFGFASTL
jgi:protochlorophyllide reductase